MLSAPFSLLLQLLPSLTCFNAVGVATQPSALNRRNAEMQLKRSCVAATRIGANGPVRRPLDAAYKHYYLAVRYGKQVLGALMAPTPARPGPLPYPSTAVFGARPRQMYSLKTLRKLLNRKGLAASPAALTPL